MNPHIPVTQLQQVSIFAILFHLPYTFFFFKVKFM